MNSRIIVFFILTLLVSFNSFSQNYYVSASVGNDTRTITQAQNKSTPWKTIQHACDNVTAGCVINLMAGTYQEEVNMNASGNATSGYITIQNANNDLVYLDGNASARTLFTITSKSYIRIKGINLPIASVTIV